MSLSAGRRPAQSELAPKPQNPKAPKPQAAPFQAVRTLRRFKDSLADSATVCLFVYSQIPGDSVMRRSLVLSSLFGAFVVVASGCASSPGAFASAKTQTSPVGASTSTTHINLAALRDSLRAQQIADE